MRRDPPSWRRYLRLFGPDVEADIDDEVRHHIESLAEYYIARGLPPEQARERAARRFGDVRAVKADCAEIAQQRQRALARAEGFDRFRQDVRYAVRTLARSPGFALAALLTLGLGIGANTAVFSVVNAVLLRPLPYGSPDQVIAVWTRFTRESGSEYEYFGVSVPEFRDYRAATRALADVAAYSVGRANLADETGIPDRVGVVSATANLFSILGTQPALGRGFAPGEDAGGAACVAVIGDGLWRARFAGSERVLGRTLRLDGESCAIVGVMPPSFFFPTPDVQVWRPLVFDATPDLATERESHWIGGIGRLAAGTTLEEARAELTPMMAAWRAEYPHYKGHFVVLRPFREDLVGGERPVLLVLLGGVTLVLLIICANIANLLLARAENRRREMAVRVAMGASRARIMRQLVTESLVLSGTGGLLGVGIAPWLLAGLTRLDASALPTVLGGVRLDAFVLLFTAAIALATGLVFGMIPAFQLTSLRLHETLKTEGRATTAGRRGVMVRRALVVGEIALCLAVVVAAGLLVRSYREIQKVQLGFEPRGALVMDVTLPAAEYVEPARVQRFYQELSSRVDALPGVQAAGLLSAFPLRTQPPSDGYRIEGRPDPQPGEPSVNGGYILTTPNALAALGLKLLRGRWFDERDVAGAPLVGIVDETSVRLHFGDRDPIGHRIRYYGADSAWITIVGVVSTARYISPRAEPRANVYVPHAQMPRQYYTGHAMTLVVRGSGTDAALLPAIRDAVHDLDAGVPITRVATLADVVAQATGRPRFAAGLMGLFGIVALLVGALGVYGLLSYIVQSRRNEIGIRMALGAPARTVLLHVLSQGMLLAGLGIAVGTGITLLAGRALDDLLFVVAPRDVTTFGVTIAALTFTALLASWLPARQATRVDPLETLRG